MTLSFKNPTPVVAAFMVALVYVQLRQTVAGVVLRAVDPVVGLVFGWMLITRFNAVVRMLGFILPVAGMLICAYFIRAVSGYLGAGIKVGVVELAQAIEYTMFATIIGLASETMARRVRFVRALVVFLLIAGIGVFVYVKFTEGAVQGLKFLGDYKYVYGLASAVLLACLFSGVTKRIMSLVVITIPVLALLLLSGERNAWLGIIAVAITAIVAMDPKIRRYHFRRLFVPIVVIVIVGSGVIFYLANTNIYFSNQLRRVVEVFELIDIEQGTIAYFHAESPSNQERLMQLDNLLAIMRESPYFGVGTERYLYYAYVRASEQDMALLQTMHGQYSLLLAENGIFAFGFYVAAWVAFFILTGRIIKRGPPELQRWASALRLIGVYGVVVNTFIGGGAANVSVLMLPAGLLGGIMFEWENMIRARLRSGDKIALASGVQHSGVDELQIEKAPAIRFSRPRR